MRLTPTRRRVLAMLDQRGEMDMQEIGYEIAPEAFKHPASATRFGGSLIAPLRKAGLVGIGHTRFAYRYKIAITPAGREAVRHDGGAP